MDRDPGRLRIRAFQDNVDSIFLMSYNSRNQSKGEGDCIAWRPQRPLDSRIFDLLAILLSTNTMSLLETPEYNVIGFSLTAWKRLGNGGRAEIDGSPQSIGHPFTLEHLNVLNRSDMFDKFQGSL